MTGIQSAAVSALAAFLLWAPSADAQGSTARTIPDGMQWTGLVCMSAPGCPCPADAGPSFRATQCTAGGLIPFGNPLFTLIWGTGQASGGGATLTGIPAIPAICTARDAPPSLAMALASSTPGADVPGEGPPTRKAGTPGRPPPRTWGHAYAVERIHARIAPDPRASPCPLGPTPGVVLTDSRFGPTVAG
jgi:hypothetical protein